MDRDLNASPMSGKVVTPAVVRADMNNFRSALAFHGRGSPDNDYGGNGQAVTSESEAAPSSKTLPFPEEDTLERMALLAFWSRQYRLFDGSGLTGLAQPVWRKLVLDELRGRPGRLEESSRPWRDHDEQGP